MGDGEERRRLVEEEGAPVAQHAAGAKQLHPGGGGVEVLREAGQRAEEAPGAVRRRDLGGALRQPVQAAAAAVGRYPGGGPRPARRGGGRHRGEQAGGHLLGDGEAAAPAVEHGRRVLVDVEAGEVVALGEAEEAAVVVAHRGFLAQVVSAPADDSEAGGKAPRAVPRGHVGAALRERVVLPVANHARGPVRRRSGGRLDGFGGSSLPDQVERAARRLGVVDAGAEGEGGVAIAVAGGLRHRTQRGENHHCGSREKLLMGSCHGPVAWQSHSC